MIKYNKSIIKKVREKLKKFKKVKDKNKIFQELCFCVLVANANLEKTLKIWEKLKDKFLSLDLNFLKEKLKKEGQRFCNKRAEYIVYNRKFLDVIPEKIKELDEHELRDWLVKNIKGFGYKEASHFLRNLGFKNFAILDRHILRFLYKNKIIKEIPQNLNKKKYLETEDKLRKISKKLKLSLAELDLLIFYLETKKFPEK
ncbi:MAG: N-glycosylase/DNA lyase [Minisyncoccia bacterium]